jgi:hypothetical protein
MKSEIETYLETLSQQRQHVRDVLLGLTAEGLNWKPLSANTNSVYNLAQHVAWVEQWKIGHEAGGRPFPHDWSHGEDLNSEGEDAADLLFWLDEAATTTTDVVGSLQSDTLDVLRTTTEDGVEPNQPLRWFFVQVIEHYAEHLGQMYLTRQLWEAQVT